MSTIGEVYGPAMKITDLDEANTFFKNLVIKTMEREGLSREAAESQEKENLKFYAGHCSDGVFQRVVCLFIKRQPYTSPESEFNKGLERAALRVKGAAVFLKTGEVEVATMLEIRNFFAKQIRDLKE